LFCFRGIIFINTIIASNSCNFYLELGDPLTVDEQEEKEQLLEEVGLLIDN